MSVEGTGFWLEEQFGCASGAGGAPARLDRDGRHLRFLAPVFGGRVQPVGRRHQRR